MNDIGAPRTRVLVSYPEPLLAMGLAAALRDQPAIEVLTPGSDAEVDVVITDYEGGLFLAREALRSARRCRILIMTMHDREHNVRAAMEAGVHGYLLMGCSIEELAMSVKTLGRGARYLSLEVAQTVADSLSRESLTARETDVLRLLALGRCNKTIARELDITVGTVKGHARAIFCKLNAASRTEAAGIAIRRGLIDEPRREHAVPMRPRFATRGQAGMECR